MLINWLRHLPQRRSVYAPKSSRPLRPTVEALEDRLALTTFVVTTVADVVDPADRVLSLREAIAKANVHPGRDVVKLPAGAYKMALAGSDDTNATGDYDVTDPLTVLGAGMGRT